TREAKGEIILFTDADCIADADWIKEMVRPFANPEVIGVKGAYKNREERLIARLAQVEFEERYRLLEKNREGIDMVDTYSGGFRRDIFLKMGGFDTSFSVANNEDTEFSYRLFFQNYKLVFNRRAIVYHLGHPKTLIQYLRLKFGRGYWRMVVYKRFPKKMGKDSYTPQIMKLQVLLFYLFILSGFSITIVPAAGYFLLFTAVLFLTSTIPFFLLSLKEGLLLGLASPLFLTARAASLGAGAIIGLFHRRRKIL
ncbi:MAG: glycosyltransferase, partial [Candidatus Omnitrophica bacterium]|nr:glycosyltransferase [Candidatus Omnitrophota bacterium]